MSAYPWIAAIGAAAALAAAGLLVTPVFADQSRHVWLPDTESPAFVELHAPEAPGAVASVTFQNREVHSGDENFSLTFEGLTINVELAWNFGGTDEVITVTPPEGYVAAPRSISVGENTRQTLHIYTNGVGM